MAVVIVKAVLYVAVCLVPVLLQTSYGAQPPREDKLKSFTTPAFSYKEVLALLQRYQDQQTVSKHRVAIYCNVIGSHLYSVVGQGSYTLFTRHSPVFHGGGWLTRLNMTCTLWKQV